MRSPPPFKEAAAAPEPGEGSVGSRPCLHWAAGSELGRSASAVTRCVAEGTRAAAALEALPGRAAPAQTLSARQGWRAEALLEPGWTRGPGVCRVRAPPPNRWERDRAPA